MNPTFKQYLDEAQYFGWKKPTPVDFETGKPVRANNIKRGMLLACIDARKNKFYVEVLGFTGDEQKYGEGGVKYNSAREMYKDNGVSNLKELEAKEDENEYGYRHYMVLKELVFPDQANPRDWDGTFNLYIFKGRWCVGSSADAVSFYEAKYVPKR